MKRKKKRRSIRRSLRSRTARSKRRKNGKPKRLSRRKGRKRLRGKKTGRRKKKAVPHAAVTDEASISAEDAARLRSNNAIVRASLAEGSRIIDYLHFAFKLDNEDFIWEIYRQFLQREPDAAGFYEFKGRLEAGAMTRAAVAASVMQSGEAEQVFTRKPSGDHNTSAFNLQGLFPAHTLDFIHGIYAQLLGREPDDANVANEVAAIHQGVSRQALMARLLMSEEAQSLLRSPNPPAAMARAALNARAAGNQNIGLFLCFGAQIAMDGEGIGRFFVRLSEGLLGLPNGYNLHIATTGANVKETETIFAPLKAMYPSRMHFYHSDSMATINRVVPADVWIVPYVGMGLAQYLHRPYIVCLHDLVYMHFPDLYSKDMDHYQYIHSLAEKITRNAAIVVFDSEYIRNHEGLEYLKLPVHQTEVVRFAAPHEEYSSFGIKTEVEFRVKYNLFGPYLTFPSVIRLHKNHERLIDAFHRFRLTELGRASGLKLIFTDDLNNRPRQQEITEALNAVADPVIRASIIFMGRIPSADLPSLYKYAEGVVVPTLFEGSCPFPIVESLLMETPVAFGRLSIVQEVIPDMSSFATFDPYNPVEIAESIGRLYLQGKSVVPAQKEAASGLLHRRWADVALDYAAIISRI
ncbi:glycosyltransferase involved in cell wall biosynthesis [Paenibacillus sp. BK033]|uniref:DUF4214 domain-containing protein n=1 Tax=Paenibacillus sp. BK033 TaxID=2512133 RepID=UPI0010E26E7E|nr:DUF4214 domain-containing protein [Paenibacillus sp. BK033]TCM98965.1 glycosyltransferase involved in cell wall biosynthesis [Paenibacillus sp. BK033]